MELEIVKLWVDAPNTYFEIDIPDPPTPIDEEEEEEETLGVLKLKNQPANITEGLVYDISDNLVQCPEDTNSTTTASISTANGFLTFDETTGTFKVDEGVTDEASAGSHAISVTQTC